MSFGCTSRDAEAARNFLIALALGQKLNDLSFAVCESNRADRTSCRVGFLRQVGLDKLLQRLVT